MTDRPSPTDEDRELIGVLHGHANNCETEGLPKAALHFHKAADRLESLLSDRAKLEGDWFDKAIRDHADEHGPSGGAWNISMVLERLHRAKPALNRSTDRAT